MLPTHVLGIDVAKATLACALLPAALPPAARRERALACTVPNTPQGVARLQAWLTVHAGPAVHVCVEATSTYGEAVTAALHAAGYAVSVVNPRRTHAFAESDGLRGKTDPLDAIGLARFCREKRPRLWTPPSPTRVALQALVRRLDHLQAMRQQEANQAETAEEDWERASIATVVAALEAEEAALTRQLRALVAADARLTQEVALLCSIPGVAERTAWRLLAELGDRLATCTPRQLAAYAGLTPRPWQSGTSVKGAPRLSKRGNSRLRRALFYPALTALRHNPRLRTFAQRLRAAGKAPMAVVGAVMHKLLKIAVAVVQSGRPFDPHFNSATA